MIMYKFKLMVEVLSSIASLVAIIVVLIAWYKNSLKALKIVQVIVSNNEDKASYTLIVKNRKPYPIEIRGISSFTHEVYKVEQKKNYAPEYLPSLCCDYSPFMSNEPKNIAEYGFTSINYKGEKYTKSMTQLLFSLNTSHGFFRLKCKDINIVNVGESQIYKIEYSENYQSRFKALIKYIGLYIKYTFKSWIGLN